METLTAKDLAMDSYTFIVDLTEPIVAKVEEIEAYKTEWGIQFILKLEDSDYNKYKISNWKFRPKQHIANMLAIKGKTIKLSDTGAKKFLLEIIN